MRVALDATYSVDAHPSGIAVYSRELLSGLIRAYPDQDFIHCYRPKQFVRRSENGIANAHARLLLPPFKTFHADLFHALNQRVDRRPSKLVISTFHDLFVITSEYSSPDFRSRFTDQARRAAALSDCIIAVSQFTADQVSSLLGVDRARIRVIPHGVRMPATTSVIARKNIILFVGALQKRKNVMRLVEAFESVPDDWKLVLAGAPSGYQAAEILDRIKMSSARSRIDVTGYVSADKLAELYATASMFAFPSLDEGFGLPVLEAMAYGIPVLTSNCSGLLELAHGAAVLVEPRSVDDVAAGLNRLIDDEDLRRRLVESGRVRARAYTWERAVRATFEVYRDLGKSREELTSDLLRLKSSEP